MSANVPLKTKFVGLELKNPIVVGACSLTSTPDGIEKLERAGAAAVILKSLFEEQLLSESGLYGNIEALHPENWDYMKSYGTQIRPMDYLRLIQEAKEKVKIPVIASLNCQNRPQWSEFAILLQNAGADALELNIAPWSIEPQPPGWAENLVLGIVKQVREEVKIPLIVKLGPYYSTLPWLIEQLAALGVEGVTLFNRFYHPDIDILQLSWTGGKRLSTAAEFTPKIRWIGQLSGRGLDVAASGGVHSAEELVKALLAGASCVQIVSALYINKFEIISNILKDMELVLQERCWESLDDFQGAFRWDRGQNAEVLSRRQYIRYLTGKDS